MQRLRPLYSVRTYTVVGHAYTYQMYNICCTRLCKVGIVLSLCMYVRTYVCTLSQSSILCTALILCA